MASSQQSTAAAPTQSPSSDAKRLKLYYFNGPGLSDSIQIALLMEQIPYDFVGLDWNEFNKLKADGKFPLGKVPVIELPDGRTLAESRAILRWVGRQSGLYPCIAGGDDSEGMWEAAKIDQVLEMDSEYMGSLIGLFFGDFSRYVVNNVEGDNVLDEQERIAVNELLPRFLGLLRKTLKDNGGKYICGEKLTIADLKLQSTLGWLQAFEWWQNVIPSLPSAVSEFPDLKEYYDRVRNVEIIKHYYDNVCPAPMMPPPTRRGNGRPATTTAANKEQKKAATTTTSRSCLADQTPEDE